MLFLPLVTCKFAYNIKKLRTDLLSPPPLVIKRGKFCKNGLIVSSSVAHSLPSIPFVQSDLATNAQFVSAHGQDEMLRSRFKRNHGRPVAPYIPQRLKLSANDEGSQMSGHLKRR